MSCRLQNKLRMFKLLTLQDGYAYLPIEDYRALIDRLVQAQQVPCFVIHCHCLSTNVLLSIKYYFSLHRQPRSAMTAAELILVLGRKKARLTAN